MTKSFLLLFFKKEDSSLLRVCVGLCVPFVCIVPTIPFLSRLRWTVFGIPAEVAWLFCCIPLTSACLAFCWFAHDRHEGDA
jgi:hypothetical protein